MTPAARIQAAIDILDRILNGEPAEAALIRWSRSSRFAGSGDRAAVRDLVFDSLRSRNTRAALGGALSGRGLMIGHCRAEGIDIAQMFSGQGHAPAPLDPAELAGGQAPDEALARDLPEWIWPAWQAALGADAEQVAQTMRARAPVWLRVNTQRASVSKAQEALARDGITTEVSPLLPTALRVIDGARGIAASGSYREGAVELQDLSPQLACAALPSTGSVLDYCAGGGGKALAMAARGAAPVSAHDIEAARMADLPQRARRAGANIRLLKPRMVRGHFDLVMADVPCSGSGTWRRTPDAKWRLSPKDLERLLALQSQILDEAATFVVAGGSLAYMTCSLLNAENGDQVAAFLARNPAFTLAEQQVFTPLNASDGFYLARLIRH